MKCNVMCHLYYHPLSLDVILLNLHFFRHFLGTSIAAQNNSSLRSLGLPQVPRRRCFDTFPLARERSHFYGEPRSIAFRKSTVHPHVVEAEPGDFINIALQTRQSLHTRNTSGLVITTTIPPELRIRPDAHRLGLKNLHVTIFFVWETHHASLRNNVDSHITEHSDFASLSPFHKQIILTMRYCGSQGFPLASHGYLCKPGDITALLSTTTVDAQGSQSSSGMQVQRRFLFHFRLLGSDSMPCVYVSMCVSTDNETIQPTRFHFAPLISKGNTLFLPVHHISVQS